MRRLEEVLPEFPNWHLIDGDLRSVRSDISEICDTLDAAIIDMAEPWEVLGEIEPLLRIGGRMACYCPTSSQLEKSWDACEDLGLIVEWSGEMIERRWTKASKGGVRPGNQPMGHTAFLLISAKVASEEE
jgi:tRNA (adenine57-N1/adenine58-N1)-methyltransferase